MFDIRLFKLYDDVYVEFNINNDFYYKKGYIDKIIDTNKFVIKFRGNEDIAFVTKSRLFKGILGLNSVFGL